jgi:hypothetical protein
MPLPSLLQIDYFNQQQTATAIINPVSRAEKKERRRVQGYTPMTIVKEKQFCFAEAGAQNSTRWTY